MLTQEERIRLTKNLLDAETAYHRLMIGEQAKVFVDQNGERIEYNTATATQLTRYIEELKRKLGMNRVSGPLEVWI